MTPENLIEINLQRGKFKIAPQNRFWINWVVIYKYLGYNGKLKLLCVQMACAARKSNFRWCPSTVLCTFPSCESANVRWIPTCLGPKKSFNSKESSEAFPRIVWTIRTSYSQNDRFRRNSPQKVHPKFAQNLGKQILGNTFSGLTLGNPTNQETQAEQCSDTVLKFHDSNLYLLYRNALIALKANSAQIY